MQKFIDFKESFLSLVTGKHEWLASHFTSVFHSPWLYGAIFVVSLLTLFTFIDLGLQKHTGIRDKMVRCLTVAFPVAMLLMQVELLTLGREGSVWWCNPEHLGGWKTIFRIILFVLFLAVQWGATIVYFLYRRQKATTDDDNNKETWNSISFWFLFGSMVVFYPAASWVIYHLGSWIHLPGIAAIGLWLAIPVVGLLNVWMDNHNTFGFKGGLLFTLMAICVAVGLLAGLCCLIEALSILYHYAIVQFWLFVIIGIIFFGILSYGEAEGGVMSNGTKIIYYWFENPGLSGAVLALILGYLVGHFWFHWF